MAGATSQQKEDAGQNAKSAAGQVNGALTDTDMAPLESNSPVQPVHGASPTQQQQQPEGVLPLPQEQQQQQDSKSGMHLSELRYELGPELKQVSRAPAVSEHAQEQLQPRSTLSVLSASRQEDPPCTLLCHVCRGQAVICSGSHDVLQARRNLHYVWMGLLDWHSCY